MWATFLWIPPLFLIFGYASSQCVFECPVCSGFYPDPLDCSKYYQCADGIGGACTKYHFSCQQGLEWNPSINACDWPGACQVTPDWCPGGTEATTLPTAPPPTEPPTPPPGPTLGTAVSVSLGEPLVGPADPVDFDLVFININNRYQNGYFTVPKTSHYFISLSAGALSGTAIDYQLKRDGVATHSITRTSTSHNGLDSTSRDLIMEVREGAQLWVASGSAGLHSDFEAQTSFSVFDIEDVFDHDIVIFVARNQPLTGMSDPLPFNALPVNPGSYYDAATHTFTVPQNEAGYYYMSVSVGLAAGQGVTVTLRRNGAIMAMLERTSTSHTGEDTFSRSLLRSLNAGDVIKVVQDSGSSWSNGAFQTSLSIIKYDPDLFSPVAWSLVRTEAWQDDNTFIYPIPYQLALVDAGGAVNPARDTVTIPVSGYYWLHISTGAAANKGVNYSLLHNGVAIGDCYRTATNYNGIDTLSRSGIVRFEQGDTLSMGASAGTSVYSTFQGMHATFIGFLMYPV